MSVLLSILSMHCIINTYIMSDSDSEFIHQITIYSTYKNKQKTYIMSTIYIYIVCNKDTF